MEFTTAIEGDHVVATLADGRVVRIHKAQWDHAYAKLPKAELAARLVKLADINDAVDK